MTKRRDYHQVHDNESDSVSDSSNGSSARTAISSESEAKHDKRHHHRRRHSSHEDHIDDESHRHSMRSKHSTHKTRSDRHYGTSAHGGPHHRHRSKAHSESDPSTSEQSDDSDRHSRSSRHRDPHQKLSSQHRHHESDTGSDEDAYTSQDESDQSDDEKRLYHSHHHHKQRRLKEKRRRRSKGKSGDSTALWIGAIGIIVILLVLLGWYFLFGPGKSDDASSKGVYEAGEDSGSDGSRLSSGGTDAPAGGSDGDARVSGSSTDENDSDSTDGGSNKSSSPAATTGAKDATQTGMTTSKPADQSKPKEENKPKEGDKPSVKTDAVILGFWETKVAGIDQLFARRLTSLAVAGGALFRSPTSLSVVWFVTTPGDVASKGALDFHVPPGASTKDFVDKAKAGGSKALFSIGGWTDSNDFTHLMAKADTRKDFVNTIKAAVDKDGWDGVDLDWEYPGAAGATQDFDLKNDLPNYQEFFQALRAALGKDKIITTDTSSLPWLDPATGQPSKDLKAFAEPIDLFNVMSYDAFKSGPISGPNFPISGECSPQGQTYNYRDAMKAWTDAGVPANKLVLGLAAYGQSWTVGTFDETGSAAGAKSPVFQSGISKEGLTYTQIVEKGLLDGAKLDECTQTMYRYKDKIMTVFDDAQTTKAKGKLAKDAKWAGCMVFALDGDHEDAIVDAMREAC
ncbi:hypothetical protein ACM66B_001151 [Microbotryomycetes sp. NB124-2]